MDVEQCLPHDYENMHAVKSVYQQTSTLVKIMPYIYTSGFIISLTCLVIALAIFTTFRKLHCTRNYIHMNLMLSFIFRYIMGLVRDRVVEDNYTKRDIGHLYDLARH